VVITGPLSHIDISVGYPDWAVVVITGPLSHIDISVGYPDRSIRFYAAFFAAIGYQRREITGEGWVGPNPQRATWTITYADGIHFEVEIRPARAESRDRKYDRYEPGPHHLAFHAGSDAVVDRVHAAMCAVGARVLDAPAQYGGEPGYGAHYYAVFFADPDDLKLEVCHVASVQP
jgi:glyoxylase I family protein